MASDPSFSTSPSSPLCPQASSYAPSSKSDGDSLYDKLLAFLLGLAEQGIILIEWDAQLFVRYNVPLIVNEFSFLVDDTFLETAYHLAEQHGFLPTPKNQTFLNLHGEYEAIARHYSIPNSVFGLRLNLFPASYAGLRANEVYLTSSKIDVLLTSIKIDDFHLTSRKVHVVSPPAVPVSVYVPKLVPLVACLVRMATGLPMNDGSRSHLHLHMMSLLVENLFDTSYEGAYMTFDETEEEMEKNMENAAQLYRQWEGWRDDEMWIADAVEWFIRGKANPDNFPSKG